MSLFSVILDARFVQFAFCDQARKLETITYLFGTKLRGRQLKGKEVPSKPFAAFVSDILFCVVR